MLDRRLLIAFLAASAVACGEETATLASLPSVDGAPVSITDITARRSRAMVVGAAGASMDSSSPVNALSVRYRVTARDGYPHGALVASRMACRYGDVILASGFVGNATLENLRPGQSGVGDATLIPSAFVSGPPTACEVALRYQSGLVGPNAPQIEPVDLGTFCWSDGALRGGRCSRAALPRAHGRTRVREMRARIAQHGRAYRVDVSYLLQVGEATVPDQRAVPRVSCTLAGGQTVDGSAGIALTAGLEPGEATDGSGSLAPASLTARPQRCQIDMRYGTPDGYRSIATYCLRPDDRVTEGACE